MYEAPCEIYNAGENNSDAPLNRHKHYWVKHSNKGKKFDCYGYGKYHAIHDRHALGYKKYLPKVAKAEGTK